MKFVEIIRRYPPLIITYLFTLVMYLIGIGPLWLIGKIVGVRFLGLSDSSSWVTHVHSRSDERMY